jgi:iduronate 2-sulfatase
MRRLLALALAALPFAAAAPPNVLLIILDNLSPRLGAYGHPTVLTPSMDALAASGTLFTTALTQFPWCAPSRNSFLSGRRPQVTRALNFLDSFREGAGADWVTLPGAFRAAGYYTTSCGKVFHPSLPPDGDAALSWSDAPYAPPKPGCPGGAMACALPPGALDVDAAATTQLLARLAAARSASGAQQPFFAALGLQAPRLPWAYPPAAAAAYPPAAAIPLAALQSAAGLAPLEYFRPTEVNQYSDVHASANVTHDSPMAPALQRAVRRAYYAALTAADAQVGRALQFLERSGLANSTIVVLTADHGQALGEANLWSMMALRDASTRVPLVIRAPPSPPSQPQPQAPRYAGVAELVDLYPTLLALAGLPAAPAAWGLPGADLSPALRGQPLAKDAAFSQVTRCWNCSAAYAGSGGGSAQCAYDAAADAGAYAVPCALTPRAQFDLMALSVRTAQWRYSTVCAWAGGALAPDLRNCSSSALYDHRRDAAWPVFTGEGEEVSVAGDPALAPVVQALHARLAEEFGAAQGRQRQGAGAAEQPRAQQQLTQQGTAADATGHRRVGGGGAHAML